MPSITETTSRTTAARSAGAPKSRAAVVKAAEAGEGLRVAAAAQMQAFERLERLCEEGFRFASTRFEENRSTMRQLAETRNLPDQVAIWSRYFERTMKQYSENLEMLAGICTEQANETLRTSADAAQAAAASIAEVTPSPMAQARPPLPSEPKVAAEPRSAEPRSAESRSAESRAAEPRSTAATPASVAATTAGEAAAKSSSGAGKPTEPKTH